MEHPTEHTSGDDGSRKGPFDDLDRNELIRKCKGLLVIVQKAKQAKSELQNDVESYKLQLEKYEKEKKTYLENIYTLQELVDSLTEQKLNYITEIDTAQNKVKALTVACQSNEDEIAQHKNDLSKLSSLDSENVSLKRQNNRLVEENEQLINQLTELEARIEEFNNIGLKQREQLSLLEEQVNSDSVNENKEGIEELNKKLRDIATENEKQTAVYEDKIKEIMKQYETEKDKNEKANVKLRSYKDKILKCAACINQLKNSRFILTKTVKEYSESIPQWQNEIIKASKFLDTQINGLSSENNALKIKLQQLEKNIHDFTGSQSNYELEVNMSKLADEKLSLQQQLSEVHDEVNRLSAKNSELDFEVVSLTQKYNVLYNTELPAKVSEHSQLQAQLNDSTQRIKELEAKNKKLKESIQDLKKKQQTGNNDEAFMLQIKALESEKAILVKEKMNARDNLMEFEMNKKLLTEQVHKLSADFESLSSQCAFLKQEKEMLKKNASKDKESEINSLKCETIALREQYELLKKEHENSKDLNGLLKDEVETLKLSLEQPSEDNLSDLNVSLQADVVKLETKLSAYKQENASLLAEVKESRAKIKEVEAIAADYEDSKTKLLTYKTENTELLNEMKEINQVLKERGEAISKLQKAIAESERLIETLEKDRDDINGEKDSLLKKVESLDSDLRNAVQSTHKNYEKTQQIILEKDEAKALVAAKEKIIISLKEDIDKLKQQTPSADLPNDDNMSTSTISKAEEHSQMKDLDESFEDKYSKLRIFALKLKKKLNEANIQLQNAEQDKARLEKVISENASLTTAKPVADEVDGCRAKEDVECAKADISALEKKVQSLNAALDASKKSDVDLEELKALLAAKTQQLTTEIEAHKSTKDALEKTRRDVKKRSVLSLEMEDYEKSMKELTSKMEDNKKKMVQMESTIDTQEGTIKAMKTQIKLLEEQIKTEETQNRLLKEDLQHAIEGGKEKDELVQVKIGIISKLEHDLEEEKRKNEETKIEMTSLVGEKEKYIITLGEEKLELNSRLKRTEFKSAELEEKLRITSIELEDLKTDYSSYKVRAQAVLRQNQTVDHGQEEQLKEEVAALRAQVETLTAKLNTAQEKCTEYQTTAEQQQRRAGEATSEAARATQRTSRLQGELARLAASVDAERTQHKLQVSTLTQCYKAQIQDLEAKLQKETDELKKQLTAAKEKSVRVLDQVNSNQYMLPLIPKEDSDGEMDINVSMLPREEGEGSESAPSPPLSKPFVSGGGARSPVSLERLLEEGVPEDEALDAAVLQLSPEQEARELRRKLHAQQQRVKHVTVLLSESERECARLAQMSELLKAEVRRARGSLERTEHAHNAEYMKNVTLKFVTLPPGDERARLVPVLQKILTLTPDETSKINAVARGMDPNPSKGWGSYLPWPGGNK